MRSLKILLQLCFLWKITASDVKVDLYTCNPQLDSLPLSLCCRIKTTLPPDSRVLFQRSTSLKQTIFATAVSPPCDAIQGGPVNNEFNVTCSRRHDWDIYSVNFHAKIAWTDLGEWRCSYLDKDGFLQSSSRLLLTQNNVFSSHFYRYVPKNEQTTLTWHMESPLNKTVQTLIMDPDGDVIVMLLGPNVTFSKPKYFTQCRNNILNVSWIDTKHGDSGSYVMVSNVTGRVIRDGLTVVVTDKPSKPIVNIVGYGAGGPVNRSGYLMLSCSSLSTTSAPLFYIPEVRYQWTVHGRRNYTMNGEILNIEMFGCHSTQATIIRCWATEKGFSEFSDAVNYQQSWICNDLVAKPVQTKARSATSNEKTHTGVVIFLACLCAICIVLMIIFLGILVRNTRRNNKNPTAALEIAFTRSRQRQLQLSQDVGVSYGQSRGSAVARRSTSPQRQQQPSRNARDSNQQSRDLAVARRSTSPQRQQQPCRNARVSNQQSRDLAVARRSASPQRQQQPNRNARVSNQQSRDLDRTARYRPESNTSAAAVYVENKCPEEQVKELLAQHQRHLKTDVKNLEVARDNIVNNLICYYTSEDTLAESAIRVVMYREEGADFGGVAKDMFTTFWDRVLKDYFIGCEVFVPSLHTHKMAQVDVFARFGSILSHTVAVTGAFPFPMAPSAIICMIYETYEVETKMVVQDFLLFLDAEDRSLLIKANDNFQSLSSEERNWVQNIFVNFEYGANPNSNNFKQHLKDIAKHVICVKPRLLLERMRRGIPAAHLEHFWSHFDIEKIGILLQPLKLSPERVIERLRTEISEPYMSNKQRQAFKMLKKYVNEQTDDGLKSLLHFITGSKHIPQEMINILFTTQEGMARSPKAHTCSNTLELPETYTTYKEFKTEMNNVLSSKEALPMTME